MKMTKAFTMIELIYVIVVLGILGTIALPKFAGVRNQADIGMGRSQVATIRSAIVNERQTRLILGNVDFLPELSSGAVANAVDQNLFTGSAAPVRILLQTSIVSGNNAGEWMKTASNPGNAVGNFETYIFNVDNDQVTFAYSPVAQNLFGIAFNAGEFNCDVNGVVVDAAEQLLCQQLAQ